MFAAHVEPFDRRFATVLMELGQSGGPTPTHLIRAKSGQGDTSGKATVVGTGEANRRRPAVIVSNDNANATAARLGRGVVTVVPVTSNTTRVFPFQVLSPLPKRASTWIRKPRPNRFVRSRSSGSAA